MANSLNVFRKISFILLFTSPVALLAQRGVGIRFAADFNSFARAEQYPLIDNSWSHLVIGPYYQAYFRNGGVQIGLNLHYKGTQSSGFPNLPVVMQDFNGPHDVGVTALEMDFKVGPRFGPVNPKIGYLLSYRFKQEGFLEPGNNNEIQPINLSLPFGCTFDFPTGYGSVGFGIFYEIGITNVLKKPNPNIIGYNGSKLRSFTIELYLLFEAGSQKKKPSLPEGF